MIFDLETDLGEKYVTNLCHCCGISSDSITIGNISSHNITFKYIGGGETELVYGDQLNRDRDFDMAKAKFYGVRSVQE